MSPAVPWPDDVREMVDALSAAGLEVRAVYLGPRGGTIKVAHCGYGCDVYQRGALWCLTYDGDAVRRTKSATVKAVSARLLSAQRLAIATITTSSTLDTESLESAVARATKQTTPTPKGASPMTTISDDAASAALRTAGKQLTKAVRDPLAATLARHLGPDDEALRARIAAFLQTELGTALLAGVLSVGLEAVPHLPPKAATLARELRVQSMASGADVVLDVVMGPLREVLATYLRDVPETPALDAPQHTAVAWTESKAVVR